MGTTTYLLTKHTRKRKYIPSFRNFARLLLGPGQRPGAKSWIRLGLFLFLLFLFLVGVANQHSWGADWSQVVNLDWFARALASMLFSEKHGVMVLPCQVGPSSFPESISYVYWAARKHKPRAIPVIHTYKAIYLNKIYFKKHYNRYRTNLNSPINSLVKRSLTPLRKKIN